MLYREINAVCSQIHTKQTNTLCGQNVELINVKLAVHIVNTGPFTVNKISPLTVFLGFLRDTGSRTKQRISFHACI